MAASTQPATMPNLKTLDAVFRSHLQATPKQRFLLRPKNVDKADTDVDNITYRIFDIHLSRLVSWTNAPDTLKPKAVVGVFFPSGYSLCVTIFALLRIGAIPFCLSPRNSDEALCHLVKNGNVQAIVTSTADGLSQKIRQALGQGGVKLKTIIEVSNEEFQDTPSDDFRYTSYPPLEDGLVKGSDIAIQQHTSGSTAFPKPVPLSHEFFLRALQGGTWWVDDVNTQSDVWVGQPPIFHMFGLMGGLLNAMFRGHTFAIPPLPKEDDHGLTLVARQKSPFSTLFKAIPAFQTLLSPFSPILRFFAHLMGVRSTTASGIANDYAPSSAKTEKRPSESVMIPSPQALYTFARSVGATEFFGVTSAIVGVARLPDNKGIEFMKGLNRVLVAGAPIPRENGDWIVGCGVHLVEGMGSTEGGSLFHSNRPKGDPSWQAMRVCWNVAHEFKPFSSGDRKTYELILKSTTEWGWFPGSDLATGMLNTHDLFEEYPSPESGTWRHCGRSDDVLLLSTGQSWNPRPMELQIEASPAIRHAVIFGHGRPFLGALIAPRNYITSEINKEDIWVAIEAANTVAPTNARIARKNVLVVTRNGIAFLDRAGRVESGKEAQIAGLKSKEIPLADKGTPLRPKTYALFKDEIDAVYGELI